MHSIVARLERAEEPSSVLVFPTYEDFERAACAFATKWNEGEVDHTSGGLKERTNAGWEWTCPPPKSKVGLSGSGKKYVRLTVSG